MNRKLYFEGYRDAVQDYGIWRSGTQVIGCLERPIKEVIEKKHRELYPDCVGQECRGCPGCMGIVNTGPLD